MDWATRFGREIRRRSASILVRLLLINLIVMAVPLAGFWFARLYETQLLADLERDMIHQVQVLRAAMLDGKADLEGREAMLANISEHTGLRLRLLNTKGRVLSDSGGMPIDVSARSEIMAALHGRYGSQARFAAGRRRLNLFAALPIKREGQVVGVVYASRSTAEVTGFLVSLRRHLIHIFYLSLAITLVMTLFLAATISRPLAKLATRANAIADGNTVLPLHAKGQSELGHLARAFERMRVRLQERAQESATLAADISHEFKSPLTSIRGAAELLLDGAEKHPDIRRRFLKNIIADSNRMSRSVGRLLELSRLQADATEPAPFDLVALVRDETCLRSQVVMDLPPAIQSFYGRASQIQVAIANLLDNAEQHALPGTRIRVSLTRGDAQTHVRIINQGKPVSQSTLRQMWKRFYTTRGDHGGSGLGLAIVESVVLAHGGRIKATCTRNLALNEFNTQIPKHLASQTLDITPPAEAIRCSSDEKHHSHTAEVQIGFSLPA